MRWRAVVAAVGTAFLLQGLLLITLTMMGRQWGLPRPSWAEPVGWLIAGLVLARLAFGGSTRKPWIWVALGAVLFLLTKVALLSIGGNLVLLIVDQGTLAGAAASPTVGYAGLNMRPLKPRPGAQFMLLTGGEGQGLVVRCPSGEAQSITYVAGSPMIVTAALDGCRLVRSRAWMLL